MIDLPLEHSHDQKQQENNEESQSDHDDVSKLSDIPCHPHRKVSKFDFSAIEQQIRIIRQKKQAAKRAVKHIQKVKSKQDIYQSDVIEEILEDSLQIVPSYISFALKQRMKFLQDKVYLTQSQNDSYGDIVTRIKEEILSNQALSNELSLVMEEIHVGITSDIVEGNYEIHNIKRAKKQLKVQEEPSYRVKLKNMLIKSKIMDLKQQFNKSQIGSESNLYTQSPQTSRIQKSSEKSNYPASQRSTEQGGPSGQKQSLNLRRSLNYSGIEAISQNGLQTIDESRLKKSRSIRKDGQIWGDQFHILSEGTKKAQQFIKKVQKQQKQIKKQKQKKRKQLQSLQVKSAMQHKQFQQQIQKQKHESLKKRYEQTRQQKQAEKKKQQQIKKQYMNFLKQYKGRKPLFRIKQQQFMSGVLEEQQKKRKLRLVQIHQAKKPLTHEELLQHQKRYQQIKSEKHAQHMQQLQIRKRQIESLPQKNFYRGRYHSIIKSQQQQRKNQVDPFLIRQQLLKKQKQFGQAVRSKYAPHISKQKQKQLEQMIKSLQKTKNDKALSEQAYRQLGNKYLKQVKKTIQQLRSKGLIKSSVRQQIAPQKKDYLKQVRQRYNFSTMDYSSQLQTNQLWVQNRASKMQKDAQVKEKVLRYKNDAQFDMEKYMRQLDQINNQYINAAEAKMSLIKKLEGFDFKSNKKEQDRSSLKSQQKSQDEQ